MTHSSAYELDWLFYVVDFVGKSSYWDNTTIIVMLDDLERVLRQLLSGSVGPIIRILIRDICDTCVGGTSAKNVVQIGTGLRSVEGG